MIRNTTIALLLCVLALPTWAQEARTQAASPVYQIAGIVVSAVTNQPLAQTHVTITSAGGGDGFSRTFTTSEDGRFSFDQLRPGKYALAAERRGFSSQRYEQHENNFSTAIVVGPDLDATNLLFRIAPDASISGFISDEHNDPVRSARLLLIHELVVEGRPGKRVVGHAASDDQGRYRFGHLKPGTYFVAVVARPWYAQTPFLRRGGPAPVSGGMNGAPVANNPALDVAYPATFYSDVTDAASATPIMLRAGDRASADITLRAVPGLHIRIRQPAGNEPGESGDRRRPVHGSVVQTVFDGIEIPLDTTTRPISPTEIELAGVPPGHYLLRLNTFTPPRPPRADAAVNAPESTRVREIDLLADIELDSSELAPTASVSGTIDLPKGVAPSRMPLINLRRGAMRRTLVAQVTPTGEFAFREGVPAGAYEVIMAGSEGLFIRNVTATGAKLAGRTLHISNPEPVKLTIVAGWGAGTIQGTVLRDGKPQAGAMVVLVPEDPENNRPLFRRDQSDSDGSFTLNTVIPGRYAALALQNGWDLSWGDPSVLQQYLPGAATVIIEANRTSSVNLNAQ